MATAASRQPERERERERETFTDHAPHSSRSSQAGHNLASLPRRQWPQALMEGWDDWCCFLRSSFYTSLSEKIIVRPRNSTTMDGWMDGLFMLLSGPSSGFVVPGGPSVILIDFSPAFKINWKSILWCSHHSGKDPHEDLLKFGYKLNLKLFFFETSSFYSFG